MLHPENIVPLPPGYHPTNLIARVCHEVNRAYCKALGDHSQPAWEDAPEWQRVSARTGVDLHLSGDFGPEASHISWMRQKLDDGWKYGPVKDADKKEHPCMVPFDQLPREQQAKDFIFRAVVHNLKSSGLLFTNTPAQLGAHSTALGPGSMPMTNPDPDRKQYPWVTRNPGGGA